jgi:hypothetical protein
MFVEHEPDPRKRRQSTRILKGHAKSRDNAEAVYQAIDMRLRGITVGTEKPPDDTTEMMEMMRRAQIAFDDEHVRIDERG